MIDFAVFELFMGQSLFCNADNGIVWPSRFLTLVRPHDFTQMLYHVQCIGKLSCAPYENIDRDSVYENMGAEALRLETRSHVAYRKAVLK